MNVPLCNVYTEGEYPHFDLRSTHQKLKTDNSVRLVPMHPDLQEYGFHDWVRRRKQQKGETDRLMSGFKTSMPLHQYYSKRINNYIDRVITNDARLVAHSFRHTAITRARNSLLPQNLIDQVFGHDRPKTVGDGYGEGADIDVVFGAFKSVDFGLTSQVKQLLRKG